MNLRINDWNKRKLTTTTTTRASVLTRGRRRAGVVQLQLQRSLKSTQRSTKSHSSRPHVTKTNEHGRKLRPTRKPKTKRRKYYELLKYC